MKKALIAVVLVVAVLGAGLWYFVLRDDAPEELTLSDPAPEDTTAGDSTPVGVDGTWTVQPSEPTAAGYRIKERFIGGAAEHTAVGRTSEVTGSVSIASTQVTEGDFTVDMTSLTYTDTPAGLDVANRKRATENLGIETAKFPEASFTLTAPIELGTVPEAGKVVTAEAAGDLTLHGVTKAIELTVEAQLTGGDIEVVSADPSPVVLADYGMTPPKAGPVASVADEGSFEFKLVLSKG
ncbi:MAG: YceI family protein [Acidimicrobiales bacterium]